MLNLKGMRKSLAALVVLVALSGCGKIWKPRDVNPVVIPPPYQQMLVIENDSSGSISLLPVSGSQVQALVIEPGGSAEIEFTVKRLAELDQSGSPMETTWTAEINEQNPYIGMKDADGLLQVKTTAGEVWSYRIALGTCWFQNDPPTEEHELVVKDEEPVFGVPALRLCE